MSAPENLQNVPANTPVLDDRGLFTRPWYLGFIQSAIRTVNYCLASVADLFTRVATLEGAGYVKGAANLITVGQIPKVSAAGTVSQSAIADDGAAEIDIVGRLLRLDNNKPFAQKDSAGTIRLVLNLDATNPDVLHLRNNQRNVGGPIAFDSGAAGANTMTLSVAGVLVVISDVDTGGVFKVAGVQVVGPRGAALTATAAAGNAAGVAYLQADAATWVTLMNNLRTRVSELEARLQAHGLIT